MPALLFGAELIFEMHAGRPGADHGFHELEDVERAAEAGFGVGDDRQIPVRSAASLERFDLIEPRERVVEPLDERRHAVYRIEALIGIHLARGVGVGGDLPAAAVERAQSRSRGLHRLIAGERSEGRYRRIAPVRSRQSRSAPMRAKLCSATKLPCSRRTASALYRRSIPSHRLSFQFTRSAPLPKFWIGLGCRLADIGWLSILILDRLIFIRYTPSRGPKSSVKA